MNMFSMKPKFNLPEFLAAPAPVGAASARAAKRRGKQFQNNATSKDASKPTLSEDPSRK